MIIFRFLWLKTMPMSEARIWRHNLAPQTRIYVLLFAIIGAVFHPSEQISSASLGAQAVFWIVGYSGFILFYFILSIASIRVSQWMEWEGVFMHVPLQGAIYATGFVLYMVAPYIGIATADHWDLFYFTLFNVLIYELAAYLYVAYGDRAMYPEVYSDRPADAVISGRTYEVFLRGSTMPVHEVDMITAFEEGANATSGIETCYIARPFGEVIAELPLSMGFQIHRSVWVSRRLAVNFQTEGRSTFVTLPDGRRYPVARARQKIYKRWAAYVARKQIEKTLRAPSK